MSPLETIEMVRGADSGIEIGVADGELIDSEGPEPASLVVAELQAASNALNEIRNPICFIERIAKPDLTEFERESKPTNLFDCRNQRLMAAFGQRLL